MFYKIIQFSFDSFLSQLCLCWNWRLKMRFREIEGNKLLILYPNNFSKSQICARKLFDSDIKLHTVWTINHVIEEGPGSHPHGCLGGLFTNNIEEGCSFLLILFIKLVVAWPISKISTFGVASSEMSLAVHTVYVTLFAFQR